jgi:hypothetical protein
MIIATFDLMKTTNFCWSYDQKNFRPPVSISWNLISWPWVYRKYFMPKVYLVIIYPKLSSTKPAISIIKVFYWTFVFCQVDAQRSIQRTKIVPSSFRFRIIFRPKVYQCLFEEPINIFLNSHKVQIQFQKKVNVTIVNTKKIFFIKIFEFNLYSQDYSKLIETFGSYSKSVKIKYFSNLVVYFTSFKGFIGAKERNFNIFPNFIFQNNYFH